MGAYNRRRLRAALFFLLRPLLLALGLTLFVRLFFSGKKLDKHTKALVVASTIKTSDDADAWLAKVPKDWTIHKYLTDVDPDAALTKQQGTLTVPVNKGNEAMVYLTYIIDNYETLPDVVFFHHDHAKAWHQAMRSEEEVARLRTSYVREKHFVSARCLPGCENVMQLPDYTIDLTAFSYHGREAHLATLIKTFKDPSEAMPTKLASPCCAQFAASKEAIRRRTREWWKRLRQFLIDTPLDSRSSGRLLEHTWHFWLGETPEYCPDYKACQCLVFSGSSDCAAYQQELKS